jgi:HAD superfamily hydrolase (TIGR01509 family)
MTKQTFQAVLWDMDGTLVDTEPYWLKSEQAFAERHNSHWELSDAEQFIGFSLYDTADILRKKFNLQDHTDQQIIDELTTGVVEQIQDELPFRPGALELLSELREKQIPTALVTMSMTEMAKSVVQRIPFKAFDYVLGGDQVQFGKPHPEPYIRAAEKLGFDPTDCIALEDSKTGLTSAETAGTVAIGIPHIASIPSQPGRILIDSLQGMTVSKLQEIFEEKRG